jgi:hypothetical protein
MADDHRLSAGRFNARLKADVAQLARAPLGGFEAGGVIGGICGDARYAQELKQPRKGSLAARGEVIEHARYIGVRCARFTHGYISRSDYSSSHWPLWAT